MALARVENPIVLVHGLFGFNVVRVGQTKIVSYFPGIEEALIGAGNRVYSAQTSPTGGVATRATQLRNYLQRDLPGERCHIIAHSMGGLDARYLISRLGMDDRVLSLTTIGTPHRGTTFADWGVRRLERVVKPMFDYFEIPVQAFYDLTTDGCRAFNEEVRDVPGVRYFSVAGRAEGAWVSPEWRLPYMIVKATEGENDGVVSVASAQWGEQFDVWEGDHLSLVNWRNVWASAKGLWQGRIGDYFGLVARLQTLGF
ncbi:MAG: hypothetical protein U0746_13630 [Gemmataceae bacterium]